MDIRLAIFICVFLSFGPAIVIVRGRMIAQANERLAPDDQMQGNPLVRGGIKWREMIRAWRVHREFYPDSSLRFWYVALWVLVILWVFFGLKIVQL
jgi:hypothetical protein